MGWRGQGRRRSLGLALTLALPWAPGAAAAPDLPGAAEALARTPLHVAGDVLGGAGLVSASIVAATADAVSLLDDNSRTRPVLRGAASGLLGRVALLVSRSGTTALEILRREDIERLPEAAEAYLAAAPGVGRLDTALTGIESLCLAVRDAWTGPLLALLRAAGAAEPARELARQGEEARIRALGPEPAP